jgi:hypothetical protein
LTWFSINGARTWADLPGDASELLVRGYKGKEADRLVTRIDPGVVSLVAELRARERQAAEDWPVEDPRGGAQAVDASLAAICVGGTDSSAGEREIWHWLIFGNIPENSSTAALLSPLGNETSGGNDTPSTREKGTGCAVACQGPRKARSYR